MNKIELIGSTLAGMMFLSGCAPVLGTNKAPTAETATLPNGIATITDTTEALVTPTDVVPATEAISSAEIDKNITYFLDASGQYSDDALKDKLFNGSSTVEKFEKDLA